MDQSDRHMTRHQADYAVKPDVLARPRHGFQADGAGALRAQPIDAGTDHDGPETLPLAIRPHRQWSHPALGARAVHHIEGYHVAVGISPYHRSIAGVLQGVAPDQIVELRNSHAHQTVPAVSVGKGVGKYPV